jgi:hypothetical protein
MSYTPLKLIDSLTVKDLNLTSSITITTTQDPVVVDEFPIGTYRSAKYETQISDGTNFQISEIRVLHDGALAYLTEYGVITNASLMGTFMVTISNGLLQLMFTPVDASSKTIKIARSTITI